MAGWACPRRRWWWCPRNFSRGYIGVGSLGTRSEIAAELILAGGTEAQKAHWLPALASGEKLPTAVFTEPNTGSDLGALAHPRGQGRCRRLPDHRQQDLDHPSARTHVMTLLARTDPRDQRLQGPVDVPGRKGTGTDAAPFPTPGMTGGEIEVLGYRGMKEYELGFDDFHVKAENLLGEQEGNGLQAADADLRGRPDPTAALRRGRGAIGARRVAALLP